MRDKRLVVATPPHLRQGRTIRRMMMAFMVALLPALAWGVYQYGASVIVLLVSACAAAVAADAVVSKMTKTAGSAPDGHAVLTGMLIAAMLPPAAPWWVAAVAAAVAIFIGKAPFGELGGAPIAPAVVGILIVTLSWPEAVDNYVQPTTAAEALKAEGVASAETPIGAVLIDPSDMTEYDTKELWLGRQVGSSGTTGPLFLILGGLALIVARAARWQAPLSFIAGMGMSAVVANGIDPTVYPSAEFHLATGMTMFAAFFLCTDHPSTPTSPNGLIAFGLLAGILAYLLRVAGLEFGAEPWAVAIISLATPILDRLRPAPFGKVVSHA